MTRGRILEGRAWFDTVLAEDDPNNVELPPAVRVRALADTAVLKVLMGGSMDQAESALAIARELDDPALLTRALTACGFIAGIIDTTRRRPERTSPRRAFSPGDWTIDGA